MRLYFLAIYSYHSTHGQRIGYISFLSKLEWCDESGVQHMKAFNQAIVFIVRDQLYDTFEVSIL